MTQSELLTAFLTMNRMRSSTLTQMFKSDWREPMESLINLGVIVRRRWSDGVRYTVVGLKANYRHAHPASQEYRYGESNTPYSLNKGRKKAA